MKFLFALMVAFVVGVVVSVLDNANLLVNFTNSDVQVQAKKREVTVSINARQLDSLMKECSAQTIIVKFYANWCPPCRMTKPNYDKVASETAGVRFYELDIESMGFRGSKADDMIASIPTIIAIKDGKEVDRLHGYQTYEQLKAFVEKNK